MSFSLIFFRTSVVVTHVSSLVIVYLVEYHVFSVARLTGLKMILNPIRTSKSLVRMLELI